MTPLANGRIVLWQGGSLWILHVPGQPGSQDRTDQHAHHAIQITLALDGVYQLHTPNGPLPGPALVVAPDVLHAFEPKGLIALVFIEPESPAGRALLHGPLAQTSIAPMVGRFDDLLTELRAVFSDRAWDDERLRVIGKALVTRLAGDLDPPRPEPRVEGAIAWARGHLDRRLSIAEVAGQAGLSIGRMSHLFVEHTGLPFRTYLLWLRLSLAVERYADGASLTEVAHEAGFADSAHFSRTFRRMFGVAATELRLQ